VIQLCCIGKCWRSSREGKQYKEYGQNLNLHNLLLRFPATLSQHCFWYRMTTDLNGEPCVVVNHNKRTAVRLSSTSSLKDTLDLIKSLKNKHSPKKDSNKASCLWYGLRSLMYPVLPNEKDDNNNNKLSVVHYKKHAFS
jgi:hypothetical protein